MALYNHKGERMTPEDITGENFNGSHGNSVIAATDMDGTMFRNDLGPLVFLEKLSDPTFWELEPNEFSKILLPKKYRELLEHGARGFSKDLDPLLCGVTLALARDITNLYDFIHNVIGKNGGKNHQPLIREFARKMMELDRIFVRIDQALSKHLNGEILMRTRFFAGKQPHIIGQLAKRVMQRTVTAVDRYLNLEIREEHRELAGQIVTDEMINEANDGEPSPYERIDRVVKPVKDILNFTRHAIDEAGIPVIVATGNLKAIAKTAISESDYSFMDEQRFRRRVKSGQERPPLVVGTWLRGEKDGTLHPRVKGKPILGERKKNAVREFAGERRKKVGIAIGDSPTTDGPMLLWALRQGGIAIAVGQDIESVRKKFHGVFSQAKGLQEKIYFSDGNG
jgi:hypothetical protein